MHKMPMLKQGSRFEYSETHGPLRIGAKEVRVPTASLIPAIRQLAPDEVLIRAIIFFLWRPMTSTRACRQQYKQQETSLQGCMCPLAMAVAALAVPSPMQPICMLIAFNSK